MRHCGVTYEEGMELVNLRHPTLGRQDRDHSIVLECFAYFLSEKRVLAKLCCYDHSCTTQQIFGRLGSSSIRICELLCKGVRIELLVLHKVSMSVGDEVQDHLV